MAFLFQDPTPGIRNSGAHAKSRETPQPFSFIRTRTVGLGIAPNLLTLFPRTFSRKRGARGLRLLHPYRRWGLSPRPENISRPAWAALRATMPGRPGAGKHLWHGESGCPHAAKSGWGGGGAWVQNLTRCKHADPIP